MKELKYEQLTNINGGVANFVLGYAAGKALDYVFSGDAYNDGVLWSQQDFSDSNDYFFNNREKFNLLY